MSTAPIQLRVNGEAMTLAGELTVAELLSQLGHDPARVAVERNQDVVPRRTFAEARLHDGDEVEIVTFVGGG